jgi:hypothetical protein
MNIEKLNNQHTEKHKNHQMCLQKVTGNGVTHIGLFCKQCKVGGTNAWIIWLTSKEAKQMKKDFKLKQLPDRKSK